MVERPELRARVEHLLRQSPVVSLLGPRQCGKTTLARAVARGRRAELFDLEDPVSRRRLESPMTALETLRGLVVIDEAQLAPELMPVIRVLVDRRPAPARFLLTGSASPDLVRGASESLAGRVAFVPMAGFDLSEVGAASLRRLWLRGGLPRSYLARSEADSFRWREDFVTTFLERDLRRFGVLLSPQALRRLWSMVAHYHGQQWNASEVGRSLGEAHTTVKRHLDVLTGALVVRQLQPWFENLGKRQVKSPKVYIRDSGLLHALLGLGTFSALEGSPRLGASWEGFVVEEVIRAAGERNVYFWATQAGAELDLLVLAGGRRWGIEVKYSDAPAVTKSMRVALADLDLAHLWVVHPGSARYPLDEKIDAVGIRELGATLRAVGIGDHLPGERRRQR
ncbi:MAG: ATP-binding protein [Polyangiaceae bacterium]|nr:ATP-binding protein [Polyangiaceae bacterium]